MKAITILDLMVDEVEDYNYLAIYETRNDMVQLEFESGEVIYMVFDEKRGRLLFIYDGNIYIRIYLTPNVYKLGRIIFDLDENGVVTVYAVGD